MENPLPRHIHSLTEPFGIQRFMKEHIRTFGMFHQGF